MIILNSHLVLIVCLALNMCSELDVIDHLLKIMTNAVGFDETQPVFMKALLPKLLPHFCYLFKSILKTSVFALLWKSAKIIPVHKSVNEYRPIAILTFLSKVFESILRER